MKYLFEESDLVKNPFVCYYYNSSEAEFPIRPHWHYYTEFICMLKGKVEIKAENKSYLLGEGDIMILFPEVVHSIYKASEGEVAFAAIKLDISRMTISSPYSPKVRGIFRAAQKKNVSRVVDAQAARDMRLPEIFFRCIYEIQESNYGYDILIRSQLYTMIIMILRYWHSAH